MARGRVPLSKGAQALLRRVAGAQRSLDAYPPVQAVIRTNSSREWDALHVLVERSLVVVLDGRRLRVTRSGWRLAGHYGGS